MSTIDSKSIIADLMRNGGEDRAFPTSEAHTVTAILQYITGFGTVAYKVFYKGDQFTEEEKINNFLTSGNILEDTRPKDMMREGKMTEYGASWLQAYTISPPVPR